MGRCQGRVCGPAAAEVLAGTAPPSDQPQPTERTAPGAPPNDSADAATVIQALPLLGKAVLILVVSYIAAMILRLVVRKAIDKLHATIPEFPAQYDKFGVIRLAGATFDSYELFTTFPLQQFKDVEGRKIATAMVPTNITRNTIIAGSARAKIILIRRGTTA